MAELDENKKIEEHIRTILKNFTIPITEDQKKLLFQKYDQIKLHHKNIQFYLPDLIKNKTLWIISGLFVLIILLIYSVILFSSPSNDENSTQSIDQPVDTTNLQPTNNLIDTTKHIPSSKDTITSKTNTILISTLTQTDIASSANDKNELDKNNDNLKKMDTISSKKSNNSNNNDSTPKKKKKKRIKEENIEEQNLPVLEPKAPDLNTKEEE